MFFLKKPCTINLELEPRNQEGFDCTHCARPVFDVSRWTETKFERFLKDHEGKDTPCMRVLADADGVLLFRKEQSAFKKRLLPILAASTLAACEPDPAPELRPIRETTEYQPETPMTSVPAHDEGAPLNVGAPDHSDVEVNIEQASNLVRSPKYTVTVNSGQSTRTNGRSNAGLPRRVVGRMPMRHHQSTPTGVNQALAAQPADTDNES